MSPSTAPVDVRTQDAEYVRPEFKLFGQTAACVSREKLKCESKDCASIAGRRWAMVRLAFGVLGMHMFLTELALEPKLLRSRWHELVQHGGMGAGRVASTRFTCGLGALLIKVLEWNWAFSPWRHSQAVENAECTPPTIQIFPCFSPSFERIFFKPLGESTSLEHRSLS